MSLELWTAVDDYLGGFFVAPDAALEAALSDSVAAGLPPINVAPNQGKLLHLLVKIQKAERILELGTLGGYSTIWLARALPANGRLISCEFEPAYAAVAQKNLERAGVAGQVDIRIGPALQSLSKIYAQDPAPFDFIFIDADKPNNANYFDWAIKLARPGTVIIVDNVIRKGEILDPSNTDPRVIGTREFFEKAATDSRVSLTTLQTVGSKGHDGFALAVVK